MGKDKTIYVCQQCEHSVSKWVGKCPSCHTWNSFQEEIISKKNSEVRLNSADPQKMSELQATNIDRVPTGVSEFDRVIGGGFVPGSLTLIGGEPGIGKSTLLLEVCAKLNKLKILYISGEESEHQVARRATRLGIADSEFYILNESQFEQIEESIKKIKPDFIIIDSIQTTYFSELSSAPGSVSQIREVTFQVMNLCKSKNIIGVVVGHITKDGHIAGPKILEHMVDTVIYFEGSGLHQYRALRANKNRFGNTDEVGIFTMTEKGLEEVKNPSSYFLEDLDREGFGNTTCCVMEGTRPILIEVQALVVENQYGNGRRNGQGIDSNRLPMLIAVIEKYFGITLTNFDIYVNILGGMKPKTHDTDLAIIAALLSSYHSIGIDKRTAFVGEIGLNGEVRNISFFEKRVVELFSLGYERIYSSMRAVDRFHKENNKTELPLYGLRDAREIHTLFFFNKDSSIECTN